MSVAVWWNRTPPVSLYYCPLGQTGWLAVICVHTTRLGTVICRNIFTQWFRGTLPSLLGERDSGMRRKRSGSLAAKWLMNLCERVWFVRTQWTLRASPMIVQSVLLISSTGLPRNWDSSSRELQNNDYTKAVCHLGKKTAPLNFGQIRSSITSCLILGFFAVFVCLFVCCLFLFVFYWNFFFRVSFKTMKSTWKWQSLDFIFVTWRDERKSDMLIFSL